MAGRRRMGSGAVGEGRLSVEAAHFYARIYARARAGCLAELRRAGCSEEDAEDIFGSTLERIMVKFDPAYAPAQAVALLKSACRQRLIDERRHQGVLKLVPLEDAGRRAAEGEGPAEAAEEREAVLMGAEAIASLPDRDRALFLQRHRLGLTPEEILRRNPGLSGRTYRKVMQRANARALRAFEEIGSGARCEQMRAGRLARFAAGDASGHELEEVDAHLRTWEGVVFFSFVIDVFSRKVVGWQLATNMRTDLVLDALRMALGLRSPGADVALVHHSDRGSQYTSAECPRRESSVHGEHESGRAGRQRG